MKDTKERFMYILGAFVVGMASTVVILTMILNIPEKSHDIVIFAIGQLMGMAMAVVGYFYGSSKSSADKSDTIAATADKLAAAKIDTDTKLADTKAVADVVAADKIPAPVAQAPQ